uniref:Uncharacterized protein n=1 Tax=Glossina palpalis gambiensis TaxID=67801 RepID=A0A1B0BBS3_9MUSC
MHGSRYQVGLERATADITSDENSYTVRRLDVDDMTYVISYEFPRQMEVYVRRTGLTALIALRIRIGLAAKLIIILEKTEQIAPNKLGNMADRSTKMKEPQPDENN